jgi:hypothetical protein
MEMAQDPVFRQAAEDLTIVVNPLPGDKLQEMIAELGQYPAELLERTRKLVTP